MTGAGRKRGKNGLHETDGRTQCHKYESSNSLTLIIIVSRNYGLNVTWQAAEMLMCFSPLSHGDSNCEGIMGYSSWFRSTGKGLGCNAANGQTPRVNRGGDKRSINTGSRRSLDPSSDQSLSYLQSAAENQCYCSVDTHTFRVQCLSTAFPSFTEMR